MPTKSFIKLISYDEILPIWREKLWPGRTSEIETHSAMMLMQPIEMKNFELPVEFIGFFLRGKLNGVNSVHKCADDTARSRGLWVEEEHRNYGIGHLLLIDTIERARNMGANALWSYPRKSAWHVYEKAGFFLTSEWEESETSEANAYCYLGLL